MTTPINPAIANPNSHDTVLRYNDYNQDGKIDHQDVVDFLEHMKNEGGTATDLLRLQKNGGDVTVEDFKKFAENGGNVTPTQLLNFQKNGGKMNESDLIDMQNLWQKQTPPVSMTGSQLLIFQKQGALQSPPVKLTNAGLKWLEGIGVKVSSVTLKKMEANGLPHEPRFPAGTTVNDIFSMKRSGVDISMDDLLDVKGADGKPVATFADMQSLAKEGVPMTTADLHTAQDKGITITGDDLRAFEESNKGPSLTDKDLLTFASHGTVIYKDDLGAICKHAHISLTPDQYAKINPPGDAPKA